MDRREFIRECIKRRIFLFEPLRWQTGIAKYTFDGRAIFTYPDLFRYVADDMKEYIKSIECDAVCGIETASLPLTGVLGLELEIKSLYLRKQPKGHGKGKLIEGHFTKEDKVLLVDDISINYHDHFILYGPALDLDISFIGMAVIYEKQIPKFGADRFRENGLMYYSTFSYKDVMDVLKDDYEELGLEKSSADDIGEYAITDFEK